MYVLLVVVGVPEITCMLSFPVSVRRYMHAADGGNQGRTQEARSALQASVGYSNKS